MSDHLSDLGPTVTALRPVVPARAFALSKRFYMELGFCPRALGERLVEMELGRHAFILQGRAGPAAG